MWWYRGHAIMEVSIPCISMIYYHQSPISLLFLKLIVSRIISHHDLSSPQFSADRKAERPEIRAKKS